LGRIAVEADAEWLRRTIIRLRAALRFAKEPRTETILREVIADAEDRLAEAESPREPSKQKATKRPSEDT
jgi:hypothetical protein